MKLTHQPITNDQQSIEAGERIYELRDFQEGTPEFDERMTLEALVLTYEQFIVPETLDAPTFGEFLKLYGLKQVDIADIVGGAGIASMLVSGKRRLNIGMIAALHEKFRMPYDKLVRFSLQETDQLVAAG